MIYAYYGDGQGKTSALNGVLLRAIAVSSKILVIRFFKSNKWNQSEDVFLKKNGINVNYFQDNKGFIWNENLRADIINAANNGVDFLLSNYQEYEYIFLDEVLDLVVNKIIDSKKFVQIMKLISQDKKVFISGHYMDDTILSCLDVVTNNKKIKHHFDKGIYAIKGVDY